MTRAVFAVVLLVLGWASLQLLSDPGPSPWTTLVKRYGLALPAGIVAVFATAGAALIWPAATLTAVALVAPGVMILWAGWGASPADLRRRAVLRSRWPSVARACGLGNTRDRRSDRWPAGAVVERDDLSVEYLPVLSRGRWLPGGGVRYRLTPARGGTIEDVRDRSEALAAALHVGAVLVEQHRPDRGHIDIYWHQAWTGER